MALHYRSGAISKEDLKVVCKNMDVFVTDSDLDEIIARYNHKMLVIIFMALVLAERYSYTSAFSRRCDLKGDGLIDYHEFALNLSRLHPPTMALLPGISSPWTTTVTRMDFKHPADQQ